MDYSTISPSSFRLRLIFTVLVLHGGLIAAQPAADYGSTSREHGRLIVLPNHMKAARNRQDVISGAKFSFQSMTKGYSLGPPLPFRRRTLPVSTYNVPPSSGRPPFRLLPSPPPTLPGVAYPAPLPYQDTDRDNSYPNSASKPADSAPDKVRRPYVPASEPSYVPPPTFTDSNPDKSSAGNKPAASTNVPPYEDERSRYAFPETRPPVETTVADNSEESRYAFPDKISSAKTTAPYTDEESRYAFPDKILTTVGDDAESRYAFPDKISSDRTTAAPDTGEATRYAFPDKISSDQTTAAPDNGEATRYAFPDKFSTIQPTVPDTGEATRYAFPDQTTAAPDTGEATRYAFPDKFSTIQPTVPDTGEATRYAFPDKFSTIQPTVPNPYETPASTVPTQPNAYETTQKSSSTVALQSSTTSIHAPGTSTVSEAPPNPYEIPIIPESSSPSPHETTIIAQPTTSNSFETPLTTSSQPPSPSETTQSSPGTQPPPSPPFSEGTPTVPVTNEASVTPTSPVTPLMSMTTQPSASSATTETGSPATRQTSPPSESTPSFGSTGPGVTTPPQHNRSETTAPSHMSTEVTPSPSASQSTPSGPPIPENIQTTTAPAPSTPNSNRPTSEFPTTVQPPGNTETASISTVSEPHPKNTPPESKTSPGTTSAFSPGPSTPPRGVTEVSTPATPSESPTPTISVGQPSVSSAAPPTKGIMTTNVPGTTEQGRTTPSVPPNRIRGKPHVICEEGGIVFNAKTFFPFVGEVFARDRKDNPLCHKRFDGADNQIGFIIPYKECGRLNPGARAEESEYSVEVVVSYQNEDGSSTIQSFLARCVNQRIRYETENIPRRIEEALEELNLIPTKVEQKAAVPDCLMRIVPEPEEHHGYGPSAKEAVEDATIGQQLRIEWSLQPASDAYGFHVRNCTVRDKLSGQEYLVIDENGCSTDINILGHPHYDTYHDLAIVHWHAFKVPDNALLSIRCSFIICSDIADENGVSNCDDIPTPPFCPDLITAPVNSLLFDLENNAVVKRSVDKMHVHADICVSDKDKPASDYCLSDAYLADKRAHLRRVGEEGSVAGDRRVCVSRMVFSALTALSALLLALALGVYASVALVRRRRRWWSEQIGRLPSSAGCYVR